jgi:hypothetical protein
MYLKVVACEVLLREVCRVVADAPSLCDVVFMSQGYHNEVDHGRVALQEMIDTTPAGRYDAILLGYGLCNNLTAGLIARDTPLVLPRAHDCITVLLGSKQRYDEQFAACPGSYYYSSGWLAWKHRSDGRDDVGQLGYSRQEQYQSYVEKYGEDNAKYLLEALGGWHQHYERGVLISFDHDRCLALDDEVRRICEGRGWRYEALPGDLALLERGVRGGWPPEEFLTVPPGHRVRASWQADVVAATPVE